MIAVQVHTWSAQAHDAELLNCPCGQPVEDCHTTHCPRCGVTLERAAS